LREALARSDHDFVLTAPRRPTKKAVHREPGSFAKLISAVARHPRRTLAFVLFGGVFCGIAANALFFQTARHPAPIFAGPVVARPMQPMAAPVPQPVPRQAEAPGPSNAIAKLIDAPPVAAPQPAASSPATAPAQTRTNAAAPKDQIGALIGGLVDDGTDPARVMAVQKALVKLGYVVKPDGVMGNGTRQALQMFEQSRKITVTGELTPRTLRELGAQSGIAIP
jgi:hypothetical protein